MKDEAVFILLIVGAALVLTMAAFGVLSVIGLIN